MKAEKQRTAYNRAMGLALLVVAAAVYLALNAFAHTTSTLIADNGDATFLAAVVELHDGATVRLQSRKNHDLLWEGQLDEDGKVRCPKFSRPYDIVIDAGEGQSLRQAGPGLQQAHSDTKARRRVLNHGAGLPASGGTTNEDEVQRHHSHNPNMSPISERNYSNKQLNNTLSAMRVMLPEVKRQQVATSWAAESPSPGGRSGQSRPPETR